MLSFGVTVLPDPPYQRMVELMQLGERQGFEYAWTYDSHILWQESYATLALAADRTERIKLGHFVTNPGIRDPTITASWYATMQDISSGRMAMGIGRGDSSRRVVGLKPVKVAEFEARCRMIKDLMNGRKVEWNEKELQLEWVRDELPDIPMQVAVQSACPCTMCPSRRPFMMRHLSRLTLSPVFQVSRLVFWRVSSMAVTRWRPSFNSSTVRQTPLWETL